MNPLTLYIVVSCLLNSPDGSGVAVYKVTHSHLTGKKITQKDLELKEFEDKKIKEDPAWWSDISHNWHVGSAKIAKRVGNTIYLGNDNLCYVPPYAPEESHVSYKTHVEVWAKDWGYTLASPAKTKLAKDIVRKSGLIKYQNDRTGWKPKP